MSAPYFTTLPCRGGKGRAKVIHTPKDRFPKGATAAEKLQHIRRNHGKGGPVRVYSEQEVAAINARLCHG